MQQAQLNLISVISAPCWEFADMRLLAYIHNSGAEGRPLPPPPIKSWEKVLPFAQDVLNSGVFVDIQRYVKKITDFT